MHVYSSRKPTWLFDKNAQLRNDLAEAETDMEEKMALDETNRELESQRLELYQANQWADQAQRGRSNSRGELEMTNCPPDKGRGREEERRGKRAPHRLGIAPRPWGEGGRGGERWSSYYARRNKFERFRGFLN